MNTASMQLRKGITLASESLLMIWRNKTSLFYLGIPAAINIVIILIAYNLLLIKPHAEYPPLFLGILDSIEFMTSAPDWVRYMSMVTFLFIIMLIDTFANVALVIHTYTMLKKHTVGFLVSFRAATLYWYPMILWSAISTVGLIISDKITLWLSAQRQAAFIANPVTTGPILLSILFSLLWIISMLFIAFLCFFVIQVIVLEKERSLIKIIMQSGRLALRTFLAIIGARVWFGLLFFLASVPFIALAMTLGQTGLLALIIIIVNLLFTCVFITAQTIFKTICYEHYHKVI